MAIPYVGEIRMFAGSFAPYQWTLCNGQQLPISQNEALFTLIGTTYGGDGVQTFNLPDMRGRLPVHIGTGLGLSTYVIGQMGGAENVSLTTSTMARHNHNLVATTAGANSQSITDTSLTATMPGTNHFYTSNAGSPGPSFSSLAASSVSAIGGGLPHENRMPSLCLNFALALYGAFPTRN